MFTRPSAVPNRNSRLSPDLRQIIGNLVSLSDFVVYQGMTAIFHLCEAEAHKNLDAVVSFNRTSAGYPVSVNHPEREQRFLEGLTPLQVVEKVFSLCLCLCEGRGSVLEIAPPT